MVAPNSLLCVILSLLTPGLVLGYLAEHGDKALISNSGPSDILTSRRLDHVRKRRQYYNNIQQHLFNKYGLTQQEHELLTNQHNQYRRQEYSSNMQYMFWDANLAASAQRHANRCDFAHSRDRHHTGENIWASGNYNFETAVGLWHSEKFWTNCAQYRNVFHHCNGHYTQVTWATTNRVGCGFQTCSHIANTGGASWVRYILVCQYTPPGNWYSRPVAYEYGDPCTRCPSHARQCYEGLCYP